MHTLGASHVPDAALGVRAFSKGKTDNKTRSRHSLLHDHRRGVHAYRPEWSETLTRTGSQFSPQPSPTQSPVPASALQSPASFAMGSRVRFPDFPSSVRNPSGPEVSGDSRLLAFSNSAARGELPVPFSALPGFRFRITSSALSFLPWLHRNPRQPTPCSSKSNEQPAAALRQGLASCAPRSSQQPPRRSAEFAAGGFGVYLKDGTLAILDYVSHRLPSSKRTSTFGSPSGVAVVWELCLVSWGDPGRDTGEARSEEASSSWDTDGACGTRASGLCLREPEMTMVLTASLWSARARAWETERQRDRETDSVRLGARGPWLVPDWAGGPVGGGGASVTDAYGDRVSDVVIY